MKNLFDYATKELSQDAFLRWLFESYEDSDLQPLVYDFLRSFCAFSENEKIKKLESVPQWNKIDISIWIETDKREFALFIEDKTYSNEHNQLSEYNRDILAKCTDYTSYKIFYKTSYIGDEEKQRIEEAGWEPYNIDAIYGIVKKYATSSNMILKQYVEHIQRSYQACMNTDKPRESNNNIDWLAWQAYFRNTVAPNLVNKNKLQWWILKGQFPYALLGINLKGYQKNIPYLEVRSRDCCNGNFVVRFLCYGMPDADIAQQMALIEKLKINDNWKCKNIKTQKRGKSNYYPKQIAVAKRECQSSEKFIEFINIFVAQYLEFMKDWQ